MFLWIYSVLEQISNDQFHLPDKDLFPMLCIGWYNCALKWLDVDYFLIFFVTGLLVCMKRLFSHDIMGHLILFCFFCLFVYTIIHECESIALAADFIDSQQ